MEEIKSANPFSLIHFPFLSLFLYAPQEHKVNHLKGNFVPLSVILLLIFHFSPPFYLPFILQVTEF